MYVLEKTISELISVLLSSYEQSASYIYVLLLILCYLSTLMFKSIVFYMTFDYSTIHIDNKIYTLNISFSRSLILVLLMDFLMTL